MSVTVESKDLAKDLQKALALLRDTRPVMKAIGRVLESNAQMRFDTKTAPDGSAWKPWAASTAKQRAKEGRGTLLEYTGRMRASLAVDVDKNSVEIGFGVPYAQFVEATRPVLLDGGQLGTEDADDVMDAASKAIRKQFRLETS
jgi:phage gpG-like protein